MTLDQNQQAELDHLVNCSLTHPNWAEYAMWKAQRRAAKDPAYWSWLPLKLSQSLEGLSSSATPDERQRTA